MTTSGMSPVFSFLSAIFIFLLVLTYSHYGNINNQDFHLSILFFFYAEKVNCWAGIFWSGQAKTYGLHFLGQVNVLNISTALPKML